MKVSVQVLVHPDDDTQAAPVVREVLVLDRDQLSADTSFEPRHGEVPAGWHVVRKPAQQGGRRLESQAHRDLSTLRPGSLPSRPGPHRLPKR